MAKTVNPMFGNFDYSEFAKMFDPAKFDFEKIAATFKVPAMDTNLFLEMQRKNVEAFAAANKIALEGVQTVARRQVEIMRDSMKEAGDAVSAINAAKTVEEKVAKQAEATKAAYLKGVADMRELSELGAKSGQEAFEVLNARVTEGLDEFGKQVKKVA
jgi:phasin family protein